MLVKDILLSTSIMKSCFPCLSGPCIPNPCHNGGTCEISEAYRGDTFIGYVCKCPRGFNGIHCQHSKLVIFNVLLFFIDLVCTSHYPSCLQSSHRCVEQHEAQAFWLMLPLYSTCNLPWWGLLQSPYSVWLAICLLALVINIQYKLQYVVIHVVIFVSLLHTCS